MTYTDNFISVRIPDQNTPIVVFFGPPASGKTLALMRMTRFLESQDYQVIPEVAFLPESDQYARMCSELKNMAYSDYYTPAGIGFMLVKVFDRKGRPMCQILKAPGGHYFDGFPNFDFPTYIDAIRTSPNRKVWVFFVEQGWGKDQAERNLYAQKICTMQGLISPNDKVVFLLNKADRQRQFGQYDRSGKPRKSLFLEKVKKEYPGIFTRYQNSGLMKLLYGEYNSKVICFSSGVFNKHKNGREIWTLEEDWYCSELWNAIK